MKSFIRKMGHIFHFCHDFIYTYWKTLETDFKFKEPLNFLERQHFLDFYPAFHGSDLVVYDIGAANGVVSRVFAKMMNVKQVFSFEPIKSAFTELELKSKNFPEIICFNVALGDFNGESPMFVIDDSRDSSSILKMGKIHKDEVSDFQFNNHLETVRVARLDDFVAENQLPPPDVIKLDVQGFEARVITGGFNTISKSKFCIVEISFIPLYEGGPLFDDLYGNLRSLGFCLIGVCKHPAGDSGKQLQIDGIFQNEKCIQDND
jgi:FkbM family methyltransferase